MLRIRLFSLSFYFLFLKEENVWARSFTVAWHWDRVSWRQECVMEILLTSRQTERRKKQHFKYYVYVCLCGYLHRSAVPTETSRPCLETGETVSCLTWVIPINSGSWQDQYTPFTTLQSDVGLFIFKVRLEARARSEVWLGRLRHDLQQSVQTHKTEMRNTNFPFESNFKKNKKQDLGNFGSFLSSLLQTRVVVLWGWQSLQVVLKVSWLIFIFGDHIQILRWEVEVQRSQWPFVFEI